MRCQGSARRPYRAPFLMLFALALGVWATGGCALFGSKLLPVASTSSGEIKMDRPARRTLRVTQHTCRRDELGRLVVLGRFVNAADEPFRAKVRVKFEDEHGMWERGAYDMDRHDFPPGASTVEWTSYIRNAVRYEIEIRSARLLPW